MLLQRVRKVNGQVVGYHNEIGVSRELSYGRLKSENTNAF